MEILNSLRSLLKCIKLKGILTYPTTFSTTIIYFSSEKPICGRSGYFGFLTQLAIKINQSLDESEPFKCLMAPHLPSWSDPQFHIYLKKHNDLQSALVKKTEIQKRKISVV